MSSSKKQQLNFPFSVYFDIFLIGLLSLSLVLNFLKIWHISNNILLLLSILGLLPVLKSAFQALVNKRLTIDLLASVALAFAILANELVSAVFINLMLSFARIFDQLVEIKTKNIIYHLLKFRPEKVKVKMGDDEIEIPLSQVKVGDLIHVETGERVPVDGTIIRGKASINESTLTGESELKVKTAGEKVFESTLNEAGFLEIKAEKVGEDSQFARIISLIEDASKSKSKMNALADKFSFWYIILIFIGSFVAYFFSKDLRFVLAILLVVCADDIAVAVPLSFTLAIAKAARNGILIKGCQVVENLSKIKFFITDKTGTLTKGKPKIVKLQIIGHITEKNILQILADLSNDSIHPISKAISKYCEGKNIKAQAINEFNEIPGEGVSGEIEGKKMLLGRIAFLKENGIIIDGDEENEIKENINSGRQVVGVGKDQKLIALLFLTDEIKHNAADVVKLTKKIGVKKWIMLTGDNENAARNVAKQVNIDIYKANLKPEDKINFIKDFKLKENGTFAMVGDGVNDAAALSMSDVSIAMGKIGSDAAIEASDVTIMRDNLEAIPEVMEIGKNVMKIVKQIFLLWAITNFFGLFLVFGGFIGPRGASVYNFVTDFIPILNTFRIGIFSRKRTTKNN